MYIVFEGIVGCGKSTQTKLYKKYLSSKYPDKEIVLTKEPGGTEIANMIRKIVQGTNFNEDMEYICEAYLYAASRAQSLRKVVKPTIEVGNYVISDRNFITSLANQAFGRNLGVEKVLEINKEAIEGFTPDKIIFIDTPVEVCISRLNDHDGDKFEKLGIDFHTKVYEGYKQLSKLPMFKNKWITIDGSKSIEQIQNEVISKLGL